MRISSGYVLFRGAVIYLKLYCDTPNPYCDRYHDTPKVKEEKYE